MATDGVPDLDAVLSSIEHAHQAHPGFRWKFTRTPCPNGAYVVDYATNEVYIHRYLTAEETFRAFVAAVVELDGNAAACGRDRMAG